MKTCERCGKGPLTGLQKRFCSRECKNRACVSEFRRKLKLKAVAYLGGKCNRCGYNKCVRALSFHHKDPSKKDFKFGSGAPKKWETIKKELDKCELLCANCHAEEHERLELAA